MKIKTSELSGAALDWAVAQAAEEEVHYEYVDSERRKMLLSKWNDYSRDGDFSQQEEWSPSTDWSQGGPLIERFKADIEVHPDTNRGWVSHIFTDDCGMVREFGSSPLECLCRAIVAAKLGDEVDVPEGLV